MSLLRYSVPAIPKHIRKETVNPAIKTHFVFEGGGAEGGKSLSRLTLTPIEGELWLMKTEDSGGRTGGGGAIGALWEAEDSVRGAVSGWLCWGRF